jgi:poly(3-hydroxybutyrate) depolymerase
MLFLTHDRIPYDCGAQMVVLYPQAIKSSDIPYNPKGCWDWCVQTQHTTRARTSHTTAPDFSLALWCRWGYTGEDYATQAGPQMAAIKNMINALARTQ